MIQFPIEATDDAGFAALAQRAAVGAALLHSSDLLHVVKVDSWFGDRWYAFVCKAAGALGLRDPINLKVPPFHPHRVVLESRFRLDDPVAEVPITRPLHTLRSSESNMNNSIAKLGDSMTFCWYSGGTAEAGRGAVMIYSSTPHGPLGWYAGLEQRQEWAVVKLVGADERMWEAVLGRGKAARQPHGAIDDRG